jgi:phage tail protein X
MPSIYTTIQGDTVDLACAKVYGRTKVVTEMVLDANPGLAELGDILPFATRIVMPDMPKQVTARPLVSLWG